MPIFGYTISELRTLTNKSRTALETWLSNHKIKPLTYEAIYPQEVLDMIRAARRGRPRKKIDESNWYENEQKEYRYDLEHDPDYDPTDKGDYLTQIRKGEYRDFFANAERDLRRFPTVYDYHILYSWLIRELTIEIFYDYRRVWELGELPVSGDAIVEAFEKEITKVNELFKEYAGAYEYKEDKPMETYEPAPIYISTIPLREEIIDSVVFHDWGVIEIPLLGTTAAGQAIDFGDLDPYPPTRPWAASLIKSDIENYYCVTVRGDSMTEADIKDGDFALLSHTNIPQNGEIMLVRHHNSSTLKRIRIIENKLGKEEIFICWEDGSKRREMLNGDGFEIQGLLIAIERKARK